MRGERIIVAKNGYQSFSDGFLSDTIIRNSALFFLVNCFIQDYVCFVFLTLTKKMRRTETWINDFPFMP